MRMSQRRPLDVIQVNKPCPADWNQMDGDDTRRFCEHCQKFVHNFSAMPTDQAERLVCENVGSLCVRFAREQTSGRVLTLDYAPRVTSRRRAILTILSIAASCGFTAAWGAYKLLRKDPPPPTPRMVMGDVCIPPAPLSNPAPSTSE
jgi:hypothetical protein